jgi:hypothetical protein
MNEPYSLGTTTITWSATDEYGNTSSCEQNVTIEYTIATIYVHGALHTTGLGRTPTTGKTALPLELRVFDKNGSSADPKDFENLWEYGNALQTINGFTIPGINDYEVSTFGGGPTNMYTLQVPSRNCVSDAGYMIIGKATVGTTNIYVGSPVELPTTGSSTKKYFQAIQNANGKVLPAITSAIPGSLLLIAEPAYIEFTESEELFPVICESVDGEWDVRINLDPPEGFVSIPGSLSTEVITSDMSAVQFTVQDIGSSWTHTKVTHKIKHNGQDKEVICNPSMINKQTKKKMSDDIDEQIENWEGDIFTVKLKQNSPNPFSYMTEIQYFVSQREHVSLILTDITGKVVANLIDSYVPPSWNTLIINGSGLTPGVYIVRIESQGKTDMMKIIKAE